MPVITSLISDWELQESSGDALDAIGSNQLTETSGTIGASGGYRVLVAANTEYFGHTSNSDFQMGDIDYSFEIWVQVTANTQTAIILSKDIDSPANARDFTFDMNGGAPRFYINGGGGGLLVLWLSNLSTGNTYQCLFGHSATADQLWLTINNATPITAATGGAVPQSSSSSPFQIGSRAYSGFEGYVDANVKHARMWKRDIRADSTWLYNSGAGRTYADIVAEAGGTAAILDPFGTAGFFGN